MEKVERPWGTYEIVKENKDYKVKVLTINPGESISLQYHNHRIEYWHILEGYGSIRLYEYGDKISPVELVYSTGDQIKVPKKYVHKISAKKETVIMEVQEGTYLEEDDIIRLEDQYGRLTKE